MATVEKGAITSKSGPADRNGDETIARVQPLSHRDAVSCDLTIPWYLRGEMGDLSPGDEVLYVYFEDNTGMVLMRMDGDWDGQIPGDVEIFGDLKTSEVDSHNRHQHGGVETGSGETTKPTG